MTIKTDNVFVVLESESSMDIFFIGKISKDLADMKIDSHTTISEDTAKLSVNKGDFTKYLIKKVD